MSFPLPCNFACKAMLLLVFACLLSTILHPCLRGRAHAPAAATLPVQEYSWPTVHTALFLSAAVMALVVAAALVHVRRLAQRETPAPRPSMYARFADDWGVTRESIVQAEAHVRCEFGDSLLSDSLATFLCAKGVTDHDASHGLDSAVKKNHADMPHVFVMRSLPYLYWFLTADHPFAKAMRERAHRLLTQGDTALSTDGALQPWRA